MKVVCVSDTHFQHEEVAIPEGDLLIHAGDFSLYGNLKEVALFNEWAKSLPMPVVVIAGNHDSPLEDYPFEARKLLKNVIYLQDEEVTVNGLRIYGSPWTPLFYDWSFMLEKGGPIRKKWEMIPHGLDILVTHGPPFGKGDRNNHGNLCGCEDLREVVLDRKPTYHVFGHIHPGAGIYMGEHTTFVNAAICNDQLNPVNDPIVLEIEK